MRISSFYRNEFIYKGWKVMMIRTQGMKVCVVNYWPAVDFDKINSLKTTNKILYDNLQIILKQNTGSFHIPAQGYNPNYEHIVIATKNHIDWNLGIFDVTRKLNA